MSDKPMQPACPIGFEHVNRYWDPIHHIWVAKILPGEYYLSQSADEAIATTLGSCISACIRNIETGVGGINHFMLPIIKEGEVSQKQNHYRYGNIAMDRLIGDILSFGGSKQDLEIKLAGGARVIQNAPDIGAENINFILAYLTTRGLKAEVKQLGGDLARKVMYYPSTGKLMLKRIGLKQKMTIVDREKAYQRRIKATMK